MKNCLLIFFLNLFFIISCSSDDSNDYNFNKTLLYGKWYFQNICPSQNQLILHENGNYTRIYSNDFCDENMHNTYKYSGTYSVKSDNIRINQLSEELLEEGENHPPTDNLSVTKIHSKIIELSAEKLVIEYKNKNNTINEIFYVYWRLER